MKKLLLTILVSTVAVLNLNAKIWRINNNTNPVIPADFTNGQAAHNAASAGDTLYFESSSTTYPIFTIRKQLTVIGLGAFLNNYASYQAPGRYNASVGGITIKPGGSGTIITGLQIGSQVIADTVNNIKIFRNYLVNVYLNKTTTSVIYHNFTAGSISLSNGSGASIYNNLVWGSSGIIVGPSDAAAIYQNTITGNVGVHNSTVSNNIIGSAGVSNTTFSHNVLIQNSYSSNSVNITSGSNNVFGQSASNIYTQSNTAPDKYYELKAGSPAVGAGTGGANCGFTGGATPYVFSALQPNIPSIYRLDVPATVTGATMPVTVSTKSN